MTVSQFYAEVLGKKCAGQYRCRWCGTDCTDKYNQFMWSELKPIKEFCKCPANHYVCYGCWLYRRQNGTINFVNGTYKDRQQPRNFSWILTPAGLRAFNPPELGLLEILLKPPTKFALSLIDQTPNQIQLAVLNDHKEIQADTPLAFTMNGSRMTYTVYELQEAIDHQEIEGKEPGVRLLLNMIGELPKKPPQEKRDRGRPVLAETNTTDVKRVVNSAPVTSGGRRK